MQIPVTTPILEDLLRPMVDMGASDLHLAANRPVRIRLDGRLMVLPSHEALSEQALEALLLPLLDDAHRERLHAMRELDIGFAVPGLGRFRGNFLWQQGLLGAVFRYIPTRPLTLSELGMPGVLAELACRPRGLVLVTGPTGSGKTTTLAAMIDYVNRTFPLHIVTIEDPTEYLHEDMEAFVRQRELGTDTLTFASALKYVLRQDPDVILVGEMRDLETISLAVTAAETGHLVLATLHTTSAASTVERVIDVFPPSQQQQIRAQLATTLEGVVCQTLVARRDGRGRACAMEILVATNAVRTLIRESKTHQLQSVMMASGQQGMQTLNMSLHALVTGGTISADDAIARSGAPDELRLLLGRP